MTNYIYADDVAPAFPKGTIIHVTAFYDNTTANKNNPDPNQWVGYGDRTVDEMAHAWMNVYYLSDAEYQEWQCAAHKKPATRRRTSSSSSVIRPARGPCALHAAPRSALEQRTPRPYSAERDFA